MKLLVMNWISRVVLAFFLVLCVLGITQIVIQKNSIVSFDYNMIGLILGITFINVWYSYTGTFKIKWWIMLVVTFFLMYIPKKILEWTSNEQINLPIFVYVVLLIALLLSFYFLKNRLTRA